MRGGVSNQEELKNSDEAAPEQFLITGLTCDVDALIAEINN